MKKIFAVLLTAAMIFAVSSVIANADAATAKVVVGGTASEQSVATVNQVTVSNNGSNLVVKTNDGANDPWFAIDVPDVDTNAYNTFTIKFKTDTAIWGNNVYLTGADSDGNLTGFTGDPEGTGWEPHGMNGMEDGQWHEVSYAITGFPLYEGKILKSVRFTAPNPGGTMEVESLTFEKKAVKDPDQWFCPANDFQTPDWWMNPLSNHDLYIDITFKADVNFNGFIMYIYTNAANEAPECVANMILKDAEGKELETYEFHGTGNAAYEIGLKKTYAPGTYTLRIESASDGNGWLVLSSAPAVDGVEIEVTGPEGLNKNQSNNRPNPAFVLKGAVPAEEEPEQPAPTSDAAIIAIAAVGCIALAGVVIAKKAK